MTDHDVHAEYPEHQDVQRLAELRATGWQFTMHGGDGDAGLVITGIHPWPDGSVDLLVIQDFTAARARRTNPAGGVVWRQEDVLGRVVDSLLALPGPGDPAAPSHVVAAGPGLWTSG